ncbi:hypothetical protein ABID21_002293 [Pseudorhizobium tarimense]|uniref:Uncharacterized protein n=1 Tax=Pseudorhizobium tarimense TaxID=1079109 RepID=A0ABV2H6K1_9HYPH|nr:hypothetical protein [Pseudorhizobium tarimense]MCJ8519479.1 hypothetical protein [Pseudorhizobium tarimense]
MRSIPMTFILAQSLLFAALPAGSHDAPAGWQYDKFCCNGDGHNGDCQMISTKNVKITERGYEISLGPGDHRLVTRPHHFTLPQSKARRSRDAEHHLCLYPTEETLRCFYAPPMAF